MSYLSLVFIVLAVCIMLTVAVIASVPRRLLEYVRVHLSFGKVLVLLYALVLMWAWWDAHTCHYEFCALTGWLTAQFPIGFLYFILVQGFRLDVLAAWYDVLPRAIAEPLFLYGFIPVNALVFWKLGDWIQRMYLRWKSRRHTRD